MTPSLKDYGIDAGGPAQLPFFKPRSRATTIRVLQSLPLPPNGKIPVLARLEVEDEDGRHMLWDVTGRRLLAQLDALGDLGEWFTVSRTGKDFDTVYDVRRPEAPEEAPSPSGTGPAPTPPALRSLRECDRCRRKVKVLMPTVADDGTAVDLCEACFGADATAESAASTPTGGEPPSAAEASPSPSSD